MAANKGKSGFQFVVERDIRPLDCSVAVSTTNAIAAFVNVLLPVTIVAGAANDSEVIVFVAALTLKPGMRSPQRKARDGMVKPCLVPAIRVMAGLTVVAELALVDIVVAMTGNTLQRRFVKRFIGCMAIRARDVEVPANQREIGLCMIEFGLVKANDVCVPAFVLCVTVCTVHSFLWRNATVKSGLSLYVSSYAVVTSHAQVALRNLGQWRMACLAVRFDLGVAFDDGTRHYQPLLDVRRLCRRYRKCGCQRKYAANKQDNSNNTVSLHQYKCTTAIWTITEISNKTKNGKWSLCHSANNLSYAVKVATRCT